MLVPTQSLMQSLAHLQAQVAQDRVTGDDDAAIAACGELLEYLAGYSAAPVQWWEDAPEPERTALAERAARTLAMLRATGEAPRVMRSLAATGFADMARQDGMDITIPGEEE